MEKSTNGAKAIGPLADSTSEGGRRSEAHARILNNSIVTKVHSISEAPNAIAALLGTAYKLDEAAVKAIIKDEIQPLFEHLSPSLFVVIETPYVDKLYRDSYYIFYASKHTQHHRQCVRLSFFEHEISEDQFMERSQLESLKKAYLGFVVLRPTFPKIIGRTALAPRAVKAKPFVCCYTTLDATVRSNKFHVEAFPHSSQDGHTITCAETTIWGIMEYFAYQYAEYKPVLPSVISSIIGKTSFKRTFPSEGLTAEQVTYAIKELGFGPMIYSRKKFKHNFNSLVSTYIESGIPVIGVLKDSNRDIGHAVNIIGREDVDRQKVAASQTHEITKYGGELIDFCQVDHEYVFMDDNYPPYQLGKLDFPCQFYIKDVKEREKWEEVNLTHIIVPLYSKIYLDASVARKNFLQALNSEGLGNDASIKITGKMVIRMFLASSRSFKEYISLDCGLDRNAKSMILAVPMPKFVWVAEISTPESYIKGKCEGVLIQDATEPGFYSERNQSLISSLIMGLFKGEFFRQDFGKFTSFKAIFAEPFNSYQGNLNRLNS